MLNYFSNAPLAGAIRLSYNGTLKIIEKYSEMIDRFICESDTGIYPAMNKGVVNANGKFILFINGDDELIPDGIINVLTSLAACQEEIVCATTLVIGNTTMPSFSYLPIPKRLVYGDSIPHPSSFVRRELLSQFPFREDLKIASDYDFLRVFLSRASFKIVPHQSAVHYLGGISSNNKKRRYEIDLVLRSHLGWWHNYYYKVANGFIWSVSKITSRFGNNNH